ncbi:MAG: prepilin-type N-terminal cleavage/methylation domain-containing protein [Bryobacteraceae bacterium]
MKWVASTSEAPNRRSSYLQQRWGRRFACPQSSRCVSWPRRAVTGQAIRPLPTPGCGSFPRQSGVTLIEMLVVVTIIKLSAQDRRRPRADQQL